MADRFPRTFCIPIVKSAHLKPGQHGNQIDGPSSLTKVLLCRGTIRISRLEMPYALPDLTEASRGHHPFEVGL